MSKVSYNTLAILGGGSKKEAIIYDVILTSNPKSKNEK